jgi:hypothetical protein
MFVASLPFKLLTQLSTKSLDNVAKKTYYQSNKALKTHVERRLKTKL